MFLEVKQIWFSKTGQEFEITNKIILSRTRLRGGGKEKSSIEYEKNRFALLAER